MAAMVKNMFIPQCIKQCAGRAATFARDEQNRLLTVLQYFSHLNCFCCESLNDDQKEGKNHVTKLQLPKQQAEEVVGNFDSHAYGQMAL